MIYKEHTYDSFNIITTIPKRTIKKYIFDIDDIVDALKNKYFHNNNNNNVDFNINVTPIGAEDSYGNRYSKITIEATETIDE